MNKQKFLGISIFAVFAVVLMGAAMSAPGISSSILKVDSTNSRIGIGTTSPATKLHTLSTTTQLRLAYNASVYSDATVDSSGYLTLAPTGSRVYVTDPASGGQLYFGSYGSIIQQWNGSKPMDFATYSLFTFNKYVQITSTAGNQLDLFYNPSNHTLFNTDSTGDLAITPSGGDIYLYTNTNQGKVYISGDQQYISAYNGSPESITVYGKTKVILSTLNGQWFYVYNNANAEATLPLQVTTTSTTYGGQLSARYDATHFAAFKADSGGDLTIWPSGKDITVSGNMVVTGSVGVAKFRVGTSDLTVSGNSSIGIGTTNPLITSLIEMSSTTKGFLPPRMTTTQKNAITSPAEGLIVYDLTLHKLYLYTGSAWEAVTSL